MTRVIDRASAIAAGLTHYFTGKPCAHGHIERRSVTERKCLACVRLRSLSWRKDNGERVRELNRAYYAEYGERLREAQREWNAQNAEYAAHYARNARIERPEVARNWRQSNKGKVVRMTAKRRAAKLQRTPKWADTAAIAKFYENCPPGYQVDHVIPLRGRLVSGLHVLNNLQYLTKEENAKKGNKFIP